MGLGPGGSFPLPLEPWVRKRQTRARSRSRMAVLTLSMVKAATDVRRAELGREWGPFTLHLSLEFSFSRSWKWGQVEKRQEEERELGRDGGIRRRKKGVEDGHGDTK